MMHEHSCADVRDRLEAFHDDELAFDQQIAIQNHLGECVACSLALEELGHIRVTLRQLSSEIPDRASDAPLRLSATVLEHLHVESQFTMREQFKSLFQDMHLVWAGIGATIATLICIVGSASVLHAANQERPGSMAGVIELLANPGSNANPLRLSYEMMAPRAVADPSIESIEMSQEDQEYALSAVVSREGRVQGIEVIDRPQTNRTRAGMNALLNEAYRVQFSPAQGRTGNAVAVSMVWLVSNTTVKGRHEEDLRMMRRALRAKTVPEPIGPLPIPAQPPSDGPKQEYEAFDSKPLLPEVLFNAMAAAGGA